MLRCNSSCSQQTPKGNSQTLVQLLHHLQTQTPLVVEHLGNTPAGADVGHKVFGGQILLFHAEFDGLNRVSGANGLVLLFIDFNQGDQHATLIGLFSASSGLKYPLQLPESSLYVAFTADGLHSFRDWQ